MFIEGLRRATWCAGGGAPWVSEAELEADSLPPFIPSKSETVLNPTALLNASPLGENGLSGLRLYHHPLCFDVVDAPSPLARARALADHLDTLSVDERTQPSPLRLQENVKGAAHHLDATFACPRRLSLIHI